MNLPSTQLLRITVFGLLCAFIVVFIRTAWISDDAAITLRTVLNFTNGFGPNFNVGERVQAYTHPLWFMLLSLMTWVLGNIYYATFTLSFVVTFAALILLVTKVSRSELTSVIVLASLMLSKAFVDYSSSGLENPLSHLIIGLLALVMFKLESDKNNEKYQRLFFLLCSAAYLSRPDLLVLLFPSAVYVAFIGRANLKGLLLSALLGGLPVVIWTLFSLYYYGFPFPNTAYAKLGSGVSELQLWRQGFAYLQLTLELDAITACLIVLGAIAGLWLRGASLALVLGIPLYAYYVVRIGGDFMTGRFMTVMVFIAVIALLRLQLRRAWMHLIVALALLPIGLLNINATALSATPYENRQYYARGIADERGHYHRVMGLTAGSLERFKQPNWEYTEREVLLICGGLGFSSINAGAAAHYIDYCGLADPLLARIPAKIIPHWRIGHFGRNIPTDYEESVLKDQNVLYDETLRPMYDAIRLITRGPLNSSERFKAIYDANVKGLPQPTLRVYRHGYPPRYSHPDIVAAADLSKIIYGIRWNDPGSFVFPMSLEVTYEEEVRFSSLDISLSANDEFRINILVDEQWQELAVIKPSAERGLARYQLEFEQTSPATRRLQVEVVNGALNGDGGYSVGHVLGAENAPQE